VKRTLNALILGDTIGISGCRAIFTGLQSIKKKYKADLTIINGENAAEGFGLTPEIMQQLFSAGAQVITSGNHIWQKKEILPYLDSEKFLLRPANYPSGVVGKGICIIEVKGQQIAVINLHGRVRLGNYDCPFKKSIEIIRGLKKEIKIIIIDFHAEEPEEKEALALYLDGKISALVGTHTHVQTADERILPGGTAYQTDIGMTGPSMSVIGFDPVTAVQRSLSQMPLKMVVSENKAIIEGALIKIDAESGRAVDINRVYEISAV
jgi:2',3'-cyclic-nucleotide 2'-phosphodiesterase